MLAAAMGKCGGRKGESEGSAHVFSHMLVSVEFNFQKLVYICILSQALKLGSFFPLKKCKVEKRK